jgi:chemotaxis protein histidine kinase CheA
MEVSVDDDVSMSPRNVDEGAVGGAQESSASAASDSDEEETPSQESGEESGEEFDEESGEESGEESDEESGEEFDEGSVEEAPNNIAQAQPAAATVTAAAAPTAPAQLESLELDHQATLSNEESAKAAYHNALEAKKTADDNKKRAHAAKEYAFASPALTAAWKVTVRKAKEADAACKTAKDAASRATAAKRAAWAAFVKARNDTAREETQARHAAAAGFERRRNTVISAPRQAIDGLKPWAGCPGVTNVRLALAKLPALDGHEEKAVDGRTVPFAPLLGGSTVLVAQTGGMKTVRTLDFLLEPVVPELEARVEWHSDAPSRTLTDGSSGHINADLPLALATARINIAHKFEADLEKRGIVVHNYKNKPEGVTMEKWIKHPWVIISIEQLDKLERWVPMYKDGIVIFDEFVTGASSLVNGVTVHHPKSDDTSHASQAGRREQLLHRDGRRLRRQRQGQGAVEGRRSKEASAARANDPAFVEDHYRVRLRRHHRTRGSV